MKETRLSAQWTAIYRFALASSGVSVGVIMSAYGTKQTRTQLQKQNVLLERAEWRVLPTQPCFAYSSEFSEEQVGPQPHSAAAPLRACMITHWLTRTGWCVHLQV
eukprot:2401944-Pleurochrysis_carterae.AAC.1